MDGLPWSPREGQGRERARRPKDPRIARELSRLKAPMGLLALPLAAGLHGSPSNYLNNERDPVDSCL